MANTTTTTTSSSLYEGIIGSKCIIRCTNAGVLYGTLLAVEDNYAVKLGNARKLWYWDGAAAIEELALNGVKRPAQCKFTVTIESMVVTEAIQIIPVSETAANSIENVPEWKA